THSAMQGGCYVFRDAPLDVDLAGIAIGHRVAGRRRVDRHDDVAHADVDAARIRIPERLVAEIELDERGAGRRHGVYTRNPAALPREDASCRVARLLNVQHDVDAGADVARGGPVAAYLAVD